MRRMIAGTVIVLSAAVTALGQTTLPSTRPSTVGRIAASATEVMPLGKGAKLPRMILKTVDGQAFDVNAAVAKKPTVLLFYRGGWCRYCMRQLSGMQEIVEDLTDAGYQLLAISPDKPDELVKTKDNEQLTFALLSDSDADAIEAFGLAFQGAPTQFKMLEQYSGATHHALPVPAVYILDTDGTIKFVHFNPDFKVRMSPSEVLEQAKALVQK